MEKDAAAWPQARGGSMGIAVPGQQGRLEEDHAGIPDGGRSTQKRQDQPPDHGLDADGRARAERLVEQHAALQVDPGGAAVERAERPAVHARDGQWYAFSIMVNGIPRLSNGEVKLLQERIVKAVDAEVATASARQ